MEFFKKPPINVRNHFLLHSQNTKISITCTVTDNSSWKHVRKHEVKAYKDNYREAVLQVKGNLSFFVFFCKLKRYI